MVYTYSFTWTPEDVALWREALLREHFGLAKPPPVRRRRVWRRSFSVLGLTATVCGLLLLLAAERLGGSVIPIAVLLMGVGLALLSAAATNSRQAALEQFAESLDHPSAGGPVRGKLTLTVDSSGVRFVADHEQTTRAWSGVHRVRAFGGFVIFHTFGPSEGLVALPKRLIGDEQGVESFMGICNQWMLAGHGGERAFIRETLAAIRSVPCDRCGYNLHGLTQESCPECGAAITLTSQSSLRKPFER